MCSDQYNEYNFQRHKYTLFVYDFSVECLSKMDPVFGVSDELMPEPACSVMKTS